MFSTEILFAYAMHAVQQSELERQKPRLAFVYLMLFTAERW